MNLSVSLFPRLKFTLLHFCFTLQFVSFKNNVLTKLPAFQCAFLQICTFLQAGFSNNAFHLYWCFYACCPLMPHFRPFFSVAEVQCKIQRIANFESELFEFAYHFRKCELGRLALKYKQSHIYS